MLGFLKTSKPKKDGNISLPSPSQGVKGGANIPPPPKRDASSQQETRMPPPPEGINKGLSQANPPESKDTSSEMKNFSEMAEEENITIPSAQEQAQKDMEVPSPVTMGSMPPAPMPSKSLGLPQAPYDDELQLPEFGQDEIEEIEQIESQIDWSDTPGAKETPAVLPDPKPEPIESDEFIPYAPAKDDFEQEPIDFTKIEELESVPEKESSWTKEEIEEKPPIKEKIVKKIEPKAEKKKPQVMKPEPIETSIFNEAPQKPPATTTVVKEKQGQEKQGHKEYVHTKDGSLYVKAQKYENLFTSIRDMKQGVFDLKGAIENYYGESDAQDDTFDRMATQLVDIQENIAGVDDRLFERGE